MRIKRIIYMSILLVILFGANYFINRFNSEEENKVNYGDYYTFFKSTDAIKEISLETSEYSYKFLLEDEIWVNADDKSMLMNQDEIKNVTYELYNMSSESKLENTELAAFGLETPYAQIDVVLGNDTVKRVIIGNKTSSKEAYYVKKDNDSFIYTVATSKIEDIVRPVSDYRVKQIYSYSETNASDLEKIRFDDVTLLFNAEEGYWTMEEPFPDLEINDENLNEYVLSKLNFVVEEFVEDKPENYGKYGLSSPEHEIEIGEKDEEPVIIQLGYEEDGRVYAKTKDKPYVFMLNSENVSFVDTEPLLLVSSLVYIKNIKEVEKITLEHGDDETILVIDDENETYKVNNTKMNNDKFKELYQEIIGMLITDVAENDIQDELLLKMKFEFNTDAEDDVVEFYSSGDRYANVRINGSAKYTVSKEQVQELIDHLKKF